MSLYNNPNADVVPNEICSNSKYANLVGSVTSGSLFSSHGPYIDIYVGCVT